jgi:hypothetical protein
MRLNVSTRVPTEVAAFWVWPLDQRFLKLKYSDKKFLCI